MASPMLPGYDPAKMMEYLGKLPAEERKKLLEGAAHQVKDDAQRAQRPRTREGLIERFKKGRAQFVRPEGIFADQLAAGQITPDTVQPMIIKELTLGTTHRGRYLCGWVAIDDAFFGITSTSLLLEDVTGQLVEIAAYGLVDPDLPPMKNSISLPVGSPEDNRTTQGADPVEKSAERFGDVEKLGNAFFGVLNTSNEGRGALACYERAMQMVAADVKKITVLLNNMATCRFKLGEFDTAVQLAGAAARLDPGYAKAWFRLAAALVEEAAAHENKRGYCLIAQRVVAHACRAIPNLSAKDRRLLENALAKRIHLYRMIIRCSSHSGVVAELGAPGLLMPIKRNSTDADDLSADADTWRKAGSDCFIKGDYWIETLNLSSRDVSLVLNNIAAVHLTLHHETSSVPGISVAEISTTSAKADDRVPSTELALINVLAKDWYTQAKCIADLNSIRASVVSKALSSAESRARVQEFKDGMGTDVELRSMQASTPQTVQRVSTVSTDVQRKERDALQPDNIASATLHEETKGGNVTCDEDKESIDQYIARMETFENMMRFGFTTSKANRHPPPKIHVEFPKLRGWPEGVDPTFAGKVLHRAYLDANANPWIMAHSMRDGTFKRNLYPGDMVKRWHGTAALQILQSKGASLRYGDIIDARVKALPEYDARIRSNFANNPNRAEVYFFGTTHVAIGFNDFSSLVCASLHDKADSAGPLRFCGFEMSEFAVAKCKVVAHMLGSPSISIYSVMEVWLSSTWSETTLSDFRKSVKAVLESLNGQKENAKVISYLKYWTMTETISAAKARSEFFLNMERYNKKALHAVCCFRREIDRLDLTEYLLTGEIRASSFGDVECASWRSPLEEDIAFNTVEFMDILEEYAERQKKQKDAIHRLSVTDLFVMYISRNLLRLRDLMVANKLTIEVTYGVVKAIAALRPYTISWSNVLDYFLPDDFHDLARRCSVHGDCMYYGYSMNWTTQVFGASIIDYDPDESKQLINSTLNTALGFPNSPSSSSSSPTSLHEVFKMLGLDKLVSLPFREHPLNSTGYVLAQIYKRTGSTGQLTSAAAKRLGSVCTPSNGGFQKGAMDLAIPCPLYRTSTTLYLSWCYDPSLRLQGASNPLELGAATDRDTVSAFMKDLSVKERQELLHGSWNISN
ncbi:Tetratricopeptide-like helical domain [Phytophthora cactorum]|nr:Tetratricopeptide-like helical domain [Phytophthora cactorum]